MKRDFSPDLPEMMDRDDLPTAALAEQLRRLGQINRWFGGREAIFTVARRLFAGRSGDRLRIVDLATGYGDHPRRLALWGIQRRREVKVFAVDRNADALRIARSVTPSALPVCFVQADVTRLPFKDGSSDFALCSLALHHFSGDDAVTVLEEARRVSRRGAAVVDLVRGWIAYAAVWLLTALWMRDACTRHDGRLSVRRAFTQEEMRRIAGQAGWSRMTCFPLPWFRQAILAKWE